MARPAGLEVELAIAAVRGAGQDRATLIADDGVTDLTVAAPVVSPA